ncbi:MAG: hypothetical protein AMXMBFR4_12450 [Candidatus Hydrogenedentota bacterium]
MFEAYRTPPDYMTFWHLGARMGIGPVSRFLRRMRRLGAVSLIDVGCGGGSNALLAAWNGYEATACDVSFQGLNSLSHLARQSKGAPRIRLVQCDSCRLPMASASFDVVIASHIIEHLDEPRALLQEAARILRPAGVLRLSCPSRSHTMRMGRYLGLPIDPEDHKVIGYSAQEIEAMLPEGLAIDRVTYQGRFLESNIADFQHLVARSMGLAGNPAAGSNSGRSRRTPAMRVLSCCKELALLPALALCKAEDALLFFLRGSMISLEIRKRGPRA